MLNIVGTYECKVDGKNRLMLPMGLKKQLSKKLDEGFVMKTSSFSECIELYPKNEWDKEIEKIGKLNMPLKKSKAFVRIFTANTRIVNFDDAGRLLIPKEISSYASLKKEIVVTGIISMMEIWDKELYHKTINDPEVDFEDLSEEFLGSSQNE